MPVADAGDRPPFFEGFSSRAEYRAAVRRLEAFLHRLAAPPVERDVDERLARDFPSQRALRAACLLLEIRLAEAGVSAWCSRHRSTAVAGRN